MKGKGNDVRLPDTHAMLPNYLVMSLGVEGRLGERDSSVGAK